MMSVSYHHQELPRSKTIWDLEGDNLDDIIQNNVNLIDETYNSSETTSSIIVIIIISTIILGLVYYIYSTIKTYENSPSMGGVVGLVVFMAGIPAFILGLINLVLILDLSFGRTYMEYSKNNENIKFAEAYNVGMSENPNWEFRDFLIRGKQYYK